jgi:DNA-binding response OmpR family regulator
MTQLGILVVEDETSIASFVAAYLRNAGYAVRTAATSQAALTEVASEVPALIVLDLNLPDGDGVELCRRIRKSSDVPILMLTARDEDVDKIIGLEVGADDYMTKPFNPRELVARVKAVLRRSQGAVNPETVLESGNIRLDPARREVTIDGNAVTLRAKEFDLLTAFMRHEGLVLDRERLLSMVWGQDFYGDTRTIDVHVAWLREKLSGATARIQTVWGVGYKLVVDEQVGAQKP